MEATYKIQIPCSSEENNEQIIAFLNLMGFDAYEEIENFLIAYCAENHWPGTECLRETETKFHLPAFSLQEEIMEPQNYNAIWEANLNPVFVDDFVQILPRQDLFRNGFLYTLYITPRMSFGTGHHQTTRSMIRLMRNINFSSASVLDIGSGTGILGILAARMGASKVLGVDIEDWCRDNAIDNAIKNQVTTHCTWIQGNADVLQTPEMYEVILANINLNILLQDGEVYISRLIPKGYLVISGFYAKESDILISYFTKRNLHLKFREQEGDWSALLFTKD